MTAPTPVSAVVRIPIDRVRPAMNKRGDIGSVTELAVSISTIGLQEPILVFDAGDGWFDIFDGHRRHAACKQAGLPTIDAIVRRDPGHVKRIQHQLAMHAQHKGFDPIAEAEALAELVHEHKLRPDQIARALGKTASWVTGRLALLNLDDAEREQVRAGGLTLGAAASIVAHRRAVRSGRPLTAPAPRVREPEIQLRHCRTCTCHGRV